MQLNDKDYETQLFTERITFFYKTYSFSYFMPSSTVTQLTF